MPVLRILERGSVDARYLGRKWETVLPRLGENSMSMIFKFFDLKDSAINMNNTTMDQI